ncbi:MAG: ATP-binding cassette domain-containing protein [Candidatus Eisenbacteria bacterium]|nr:ATP-binding cassette domain-containing protein [Candidatus Latescibacterota bacterium]MBD3303240.1 ATP-binding cassette domain-containing protein [Candidatus Eisenbacteria bacterium]
MTTDPGSGSRPPAIRVENLTVSYGPRPALLDVTLEIEPGLLIGVIGPNGSGKSTLMKAILGFLKPDLGEVRVFGRPVEKMRRRVTYVPQRGAIDWDFPTTVAEVALMGRYGHVPWWREPTSRDREIARNALETVRMGEFAGRQIGELSGGQQQRVIMARALAQEAEILLLDEPFAGVDAATEQAILDVLERAKEQGKTLVVVHHDLATAARTFDRLVLLKQRLFAYGTPREVLEPELLRQVYEGNLAAFSQLAGEGEER